MAIIVCSTEGCASKVRTPKCHGREMELKGTDMVCGECGNTIQVNHCHDWPMRELK